jgi:hypothetical protein
MILMLDDDNRKLWDIAERCLEDVCGDTGVPPDTKDKLGGFRGANGTVRIIWLWLWLGVPILTICLQGVVLRGQGGGLRSSL